MRHGTSAPRHACILVAASSIAPRRASATEVDEPVSRPPAGTVLRTGLPWAVSLLILGGVLAFDPVGLTPAGPLRLTIIVVGSLASGALALGGGASPRGSLRSTMTWMWGVLLMLLLIASLRGVDPLHAWLGTPDRRLGLLTWCAFPAAWIAGRALTGFREQRRVLRAVGLAAVGATLGVALEAVVGLPGGGFAVARLGGLWLQPAYLGAAATLLAPVALGLASSRDEMLVWRVVAGVGGVGLLLALLASQTRGAALGLTLGTVIVAPRLARTMRRHRTVTAALVLTGLLVAVLTPLAARALQTFEPADGGLASRADEWIVGTRALAAAPLTGYGPEGYRTVFGRVVDEGYARRHGRAVITDRAHAGPLDVALAGGIGAGAAYVVLLACIGRLAVRASHDERSWAAGLGVGIAAYGVQQLALFPLAELDPLWWVLIGLLAATTSPHRYRPFRRPAAAARTVRARSGDVLRLSVAVVLLVAAGATLVAGAREVVAERHLAAAARLAGGVGQPHALALADDATRLRPDSVRTWYVAARIAARAPALTDIDRALDRVTGGLARSPHDPALLDERLALLVERARRSCLPHDIRAADEDATTRLADDPLGFATLRLSAETALLAGDAWHAQRRLAALAALTPRSPRDEILRQRAADLAGNHDAPSCV